MLVAGLALAAAIGVALGLLGGGGSILAVPIFVYVLGYGAKEAVAMSLVVVGAASLFAAFGHWRAGRVDWRVAGIFGAVAMAGAFLGARLSVFFSGSVQLVLLAVVMLAAAGFMYRESSPLAAGEAGGRMPVLLLVAEGLGVGALTGIVGVGGGFLIVPALVLLAGIPMKDAVGSSLVVIALNSATGFLGHLGQVQIPWGFVGAFTAIAIVGSFAGSWAVKFIPQRTLEKGFAVFLVVTGAVILAQNGLRLIT